MVNKSLPSRAQMIIRSRLFNDGIWAVGGKVFVLPLGLLISALLTRLLSPDDMGTYIFAQSLVLSGVAMSQLGLGPTAVRMIAASLGIDDLASVRDHVRNLLQWGLAGAFVTAILASFLSNSIGVEPDAVIWISLWILVLTAQKLMAEILRGFHDIRAAVLIGDGSTGGLISYLAAAAILMFVWWVYGQIELPTALTIVVAAGAIAVILAVVMLIRKLNSLNLPKGKGSKHFSWPVLYTALPVLAHTLATLLQNQSGIWMLEAFQPSSEVALYGVAARLVALIAVPLSVVNSIVAPIIPDLFWQGKTEKLERILRGLTALSTLPALMALGLFWVAGPFFLGFLFGEYYRDASGILVILTIGVVFNVMAGSSGLTLIMTGHQKILMGISIFTGVLTIVAVYFAAGRYGAVGVATVVSANLLLKNILMVIFNRRLTGMWTHATIKFNRRVIADLLN
jgi:O-antigen/teichoic acid export membrane protein